MKQKTLWLAGCSSLLLLMNLQCKKDEDKQENPLPVPPATSLLGNAQNGRPFSTGNINDFTLAHTNSEVVLLAANNATGKVYAIALDDQDAAAAAGNTWTAPVEDLALQLASTLGIQANQLAILNMEVNPVSKSVYVLVQNLQNNSTAILKCTKSGTEISLLNLNQVKYATLTFSNSGHAVNDMTWGDNKLYISFNQATTLNGEVAVAAAPFVHNAGMQARATTLYKSNWGGGFFTDAPLEAMSYAEVDGEKRLIGLTVCAPGFSFKTSAITQGSGLLQVNEYFNLNTDAPIKVMAVTQGDKTYMIELHGNGRLTRVGEKYLNESQPDFNSQSKYLLRNNGTAVSAGLTDEDVKIIKPAGTYIMAARYSDTQLLVMNRTGGVALLDI